MAAIDMLSTYHATFLEKGLIVPYDSLAIAFAPHPGGFAKARASLFIRAPREIRTESTRYDGGTRFIPYMQNPSTRM